MDVTGAWIAMTRAIRNQGRPGKASMAVAAVDAALWAWRWQPNPLAVLVATTSVRAMCGGLEHPAACSVLPNGDVLVAENDHDRATKTKATPGLPRLRALCARAWLRPCARLCRRALFTRAVLQKPFCLFEFRAPGGTQLPPATIDEVLNHPDAGTRAFR
jgi:hypothetical protein